MMVGRILFRAPEVTFLWDLMFLFCGVVVVLIFGASVFANYKR